MKSSSKLKIVIFDGSFNTTPFINRLAAGLSKKHRVYILGFNEELTTKLNNIQYIKLGSNSNNFSFIKTTLKLAWIKGGLNNILKTVKMLFKMQRKELQQQNLHIAITKIQPDCIHIQWPSVIPWFETILNEQKIPVVLSQRGYHSNVRPFVNSDNFEYLKQWYPKLAGFHSVSKAISKKGDLIYNSATKINKVVYTGLDLNEIPFSATYQKEKMLNIISVGRSHWIKGYNYALQSCKILKEKGISFKYTIVGGSGDEELLYLRKSFNLENEVVFLDKIPIYKVVEMMQEAELMLLPSIEEGIANVVVEAMAVGLPVISTNCGGMEELITHTKEGWLVATRDPEAMAQEIINFKELSQAQIDTVRKNARAKIEQQFTVDAMVKGMEELYYKVLH
ncbi:MULTISPECIES: glycosyltransferase family 4 protein [Flavobacteriaceae]|uniref:Glycosyltransferase n=2 Tax=Flavobacteriaceae TaxID=49546 RepID=A0A4Y8AVQ5_9FLAO|nr:MULTISPECIES: glycosyltransferase family 4 protein [Flavobacteriaceae]TEW76580.1 glycosyltransferase [Gramella jeungdoensis]GGK60810.1 hypothetical protein GCM10007963_31080 [Lutibacter litoralis]